jgi:hypothetical protein
MRIAERIVKAMRAEGIDCERAEGARRHRITDDGREARWPRDRRARAGSVEAEAMHTPPLPHCEKCGGQQRWVGCLSHPNDATQRIDIYLCVQCGARAEATVPLLSSQPDR